MNTRFRGNGFVLFCSHRMMTYIFIFCVGCGLKPIIEVHKANDVKWEF